MELGGVLLGGSLAFAGSIVGTWWAHHLALKSKRRSLVCALTGEIGAILSLVKTRNYLRHLDLQIDLVSSTGEPRTVVVPLKQQYFVVYESNAGDIGLLPAELSGKVSRFYAQAKSVIEDLHDLAEGEGREGATTDLSESLRRLKELRQLLGDTISLAEEITTVGAD